MKDQNLLLYNQGKQIGETIPFLEKQVEKLQSELASVRSQNADLVKENDALWQQNDKMMADTEDLLDWMEHRKAELAQMMDSDPEGVIP